MRAIAWGGACIMVVWIASSFLRVALRRLPYPFELEWMEGGMLLHVSRILEGRPLYGEPEPEFMPFLYGPGYTFVAAAVCKVWSVSLPALRLVSLAATFATVGLIVAIVYLETKDELSAAVSGGMYLGTFELSGAWFDLARVDSLAIALALGAIFAVRRAERGLFVVAGVLGAAAMLTKQTMGVVLPVILLWSLSQGGRRALLSVALSFGVVIGVVGALFQVQSGGWFSYYVLELPATHGFKGREFLIEGFWVDEIARNLPVASTLTVLFVGGVPLPMARDVRVFHALLCTALVLAAYVARLHMGSYSNDLIPAYAGMSLAFGFVTHGLALGRGRGRETRTRGFTAGALVLCQLLLLSPRHWQRHVPGRRDYAAGERLVARIRETPGEVLVVNHPYLSLLAGKRPYAHQMSMIDVFEARVDPDGVQELLREQWSSLIERQFFAMVILDDDWYVFMKELNERYEQREALDLGERELVPKTGTPRRPQLVFLPKSGGVASLVAPP